VRQAIPRRAAGWCRRLAPAALAIALAGPVPSAAQDPAAAPVQAPEGAPPGGRLFTDQPISPPELEAFVDGVVHQAMAANHIAGVSVGIVQAGGTVLEKGYGFADLEAGRRVDPAATLFRIGSITKTFTWIAVMNAVEAGLLGLDGPINDHLPPALRVPDQGFAEPIRLRHLMTHAPGFEDRAVGHLFERDEAEVRSLSDYLREERVDRVRAPGVLSSYSNYGVALAGAVLEQVHGRPWQELIEAQILEPLGLAHTSVREPYAPRAGLPAPMPGSVAMAVSRGYRWNGAGHEARGFEYISQVAPAGVMSSTASDMSRYMLMLLNDGSLDGVRVFGPGAARAFRTPMTALPPEVGNWDAGFWQMRLPGGFDNFGHDGGTLSFFSSMVLAPALRLGIFVTTNTEGGANLSGVLAARIVERFYAPPQAPPPAGRPDLVPLAPVYAGHYLPTRRPYGRLEGFLFRLLAAQVVVTPDGHFDLQTMGQRQRLVPTEVADVFRTGDGQGAVRFRIEDGRATRIETLAVALDRVGPVFQLPTLLFLAALTLTASLGTLLGVRTRFRRQTGRTGIQRVAGWIQAAAAVCWLLGAAALGAFAGAAANQAEVVYSWPAPSIVAFSAFALAAAMLSACATLLVPAVWRRGQGAPGWAWRRKAGFTLATAVFVVFGAVLALWGALQPWNP
jgi:CubicO group peptidase (beta-lactamase class C family)